MSLLPPSPVAEFSVDTLSVFVYEDKAQAGAAAALDVSGVIAAQQAVSGRANVVFAAAPSQDAFLAGLVADSTIDWSRLYAFHMDEYLGLTSHHRASFRRYLQEHLFGLVDLTPDRLRLIPGEDVARPLMTCLEYETRLKAEPIDVVCAGIGGERPPRVQ